jgi:hypothetical protein
MLDGLSPELLNLTGPAALSLIAVLVITRRLVWHSDLTREQERGDRWEATALRALGVAEKMTVHAEVASEVLATAVSEAPEVDST